jgi:hypothetical protein
VFVNLIRLIDGESPSYPIFTTKNTELNWFDIDNILALKKPKLKVEKILKDIKKRNSQTLLKYMLMLFYSM